jgi:hypothetical protein
MQFHQWPHPAQDDQHEDLNLSTRHVLAIALRLIWVERVAVLQNCCKELLGILPGSSSVFPGLGGRVARLRRLH